MLSIKLKKNVFPFTYSSDAGGMLIGHTDVLSRTEEQRGQMEVSCLHSCSISYSLARVSKIFTNEKETYKWAGFRRWRLNTLITINELYTTLSGISGK